MNLVYLEDGLLVSKQCAEAWFRLPTRSSELLSDQQEVNMALQEVRRLTGLSGRDCHLLIVPRRYTVEAWAEKLDGLTPRPEEGWADYLDFQRRYLRESGLTTREVYLGVRLKQRALTWNGVAALRLQLKRLLRSRRHQPLEEQLADLGRQRAWTSQRVSASRAGARLATAAELRWLIQWPVWRGFEGMPEPTRRPARGGELLALQEGVVVNDFRWVRLQPPGRAGTAYLSSLIFSRFPDELELPGGEWLYEYELLGLPHVEASVRFRVVPPRDASKDVDRVAASAQDQIDHVAEVGGQPPKALAETAQEAYELKHRVDRAREPLIYANSQLLVAASDPEELQEHVQDLIERYADLGIELEVPTGDQLNAFRQALPGDQVRVQGFQQIMAAETLAGSLYVSSSKLGDDGCYLGTGLGNVPVGFDITQAARNRQPTLVVVVGRPGCGKTTLGKKACWHGRLRGVSTVFVDPGQEADGLASLPGIGRVNRVRLDEGSAGMLDPFRIYRDRGDAALLAADLCRHFLPEQLARDVDHHLGPVAEKVSQTARPSLRAVVDALREREDDKARWAAENLDAVSRLPMARTCFATDQVPDLDLLNALTLLQFRNLAVPDANVKREDYDLRDRLAVGLVHALTALAGRLIDVGSDADPKAIYYIEARIIMGSRQGLALLERDVLRGRKRNTTPWIDTQNATHVSSPTLSGNLAAAFVFRLETPDELNAACDLLGIEKEPENLARYRSAGTSGAGSGGGPLQRVSASRRGRQRGHALRGPGEGGAARGLQYHPAVPAARAGAGRVTRRRLGLALTLVAAVFVMGAPGTAGAPGPTPTPAPPSQTLPSPTPMMTLPGPAPQPAPAPPNNAGMGIDGLIPPTPIQHGNQPFLNERYAALDYTPLHLDAGTLAQSVVGALADPAELALNVSLNGAASLGMGLLVLIGTLTTRLLAWSLRVDLLASADGPLNAVVGGLARDLYQPFIPLLLTLVVGWLVWTWLLRRRTMRGVVGIGWVFLAMALGAIYFAAPSQILDQGSALTAGVSRMVLGTVGGADGNSIAATRPWSKVRWTTPS